MREFLSFYSFPLICAAIAVVCGLGIWLLNVRQNRQTLTQDDTRHALGCLMHCGRVIVLCSLFFVVIKFSKEVLPPYIPDPMQRSLSVVVILMAINGIYYFLTRKILVRWPLYRQWVNLSASPRTRDGGGDRESGKR